MAEAEISLRPRALRPGGGASSNPFAMFGKGAAPTRAAKAVAADLGPAQPKKPASEIIRYERDVLLQFSAACTGMPAGLNPAESEAVIGADDPDGAGAREAAQSLVPEIAGGDTDDRDWRSRSALPEAPPGSVAPSDAPRRPPMEPSAKASNGPALQTASDIGRRAWMPGSVSAEGDERALKAVKGVLNKLTPEKFERLLQQLLDAVKSVAVLRGLITLIFENAVAQPTFVAMYAELCRRLGTELPELSPPDGETQPMSFQKLLLNTCQDEFEGTADARAELSKLSGPELEAAERRVKQRTLGNIRLIAELFNKEVVREPIVHACVGELLGDSARVEPVEDNIEALCEMLTIAGKRLDEVTKKRSQVDGYFATLEKLSRTGKLPARMRFLLRDVLDLRGNKWIPRREKIQAKKLDEIHAEAHAELGMLPVIDIAQLPKLPGLQQLVAKPAVEEEVELFPALRGGDIDWRSASKVGSNGGLPEAKYSAFLGDYAPVADRAAQPTAAPAGGAAADGNATPPQTTAAPVEYNKKLSQEERERRAGGLFVEYTGSHDVAEALLSTQELAAPGFLPKLVECGIRKLLEEVTEKKAQAAVTELLVTLAQRPGGYSAADLQAGVAVFSAQLEDLSMDAPLAPKLLGGVVGRALAEGVLPAAALTELASPIESAEPRRSFIVESLAQVKAEAGEKQLSAVTAELDLEQLLKSDPEIDPPDLPSVADLLASEGLA